MKLLAFVDLHGSLAILGKIVRLAKKEKVNYIVCAGDITIFGDSMKKLILKLDEAGIPVLMIHGNHEDQDLLSALCKKTKNVKFAHKQIIQHEGYAFFCYGGGGFSSKDKGFEKWSKESMKQIGEGIKIVLLTHAPPYGTKLDLIIDQPAGSKSIRQFIKLVQPKLAISGHLHENSGMTDKIDKTKLINPGPWGIILTV
ncbi:metallophosphoesterase [Candidatus Woesearchaeota archaeon]|nr:metallophosphoesterase [Candidatus Woesearchaeota archaeon]